LLFFFFNGTKKSIFKCFFNTNFTLFEVLRGEIQGELSIDVPMIGVGVFYQQWGLPGLPHCVPAITTASVIASNRSASGAKSGMTFRYTAL
jgi:hypothetical protein